MTNEQMVKLANKCSMYDFDGVEMVECKWALWLDILNAIRDPIQPQRATEHGSWRDEDYSRARDCMRDVLRNRGWTINRSDLGALDEAFQHAVGILALSITRPECGDAT